MLKYLTYGIKNTFWKNTIFSHNFNKNILSFHKSNKFFTPYSFVSKSFCSKPKEEEEKEEEVPPLRQIQMNPRYEAAIGFFVTGDYDNSIKSLRELKRSICDDSRQVSEDYLFLLKKIVSINKVNKNPNSNFEILLEIKEISIKLYKSDFNYLFENLEYIVINLINSNPTLAISFIDDIIEDKLLPNFFEHIFKYYQGSSYILEGKQLNSSIKVLDSIDNEIDDKYLKACVYNNKACAKWWLTMKKYIAEINTNKGISLEIIENLAKEMLGNIKIFKDALISLEDIPEFKYEDKYEFNPSISKEEVESSRINFLKYILCKGFDLSLKLDTNFIKQFGESKTSVTNDKTSAIIFSNIGELYYNIRDYKKSLIFLNAANLFFQNFSKNDPLFFKNLSLVAMNNWKLTGKPEGPKQMFDKVLTQLKQFPNIYEKIFVFRFYGEMLLEENSRSVLGNNLMEEANKMEKTIPHSESRKIYLTLPSES